MALFCILLESAHETSRVGDVACIEELYDRHARLIFDLCVRILGDRSEAEDAVQETFLSAYRALGSFRYGDDHLAWLYRIGTNVCLMILRKRRSESGRLRRMEEPSAGSPSPENEVIARRVLGRLVDRLDERSMQIVVFHYIAGMEQKEIGETLGISRRAVVKRLSALRGLVDALWHGKEHT